MAGNGWWIGSSKTASRSCAQRLCAPISIPLAARADMTGLPEFGDNLSEKDFRPLKTRPVIWSGLLVRSGQVWSGVDPPYRGAV